MFAFLKVPTPVRLRQRQLQDAERSLVEYRMVQEQAEAMVGMLEGRVLRLRAEIAEDAEPGRG